MFLTGSVPLPTDCWWAVTPPHVGCVNGTFVCSQTQSAQIQALIMKSSQVLSTPRPHFLRINTAQNNQRLVKWPQCKGRENSPILHLCWSGYIIASARNSPSKPKPSVWRSSAGDKVHFGCRPCCVEAPSAPHRGCSLWILSQKQSADKRKSSYMSKTWPLLCLCVRGRKRISLLKALWYGEITHLGLQNSHIIESAPR